MGKKAEDLTGKRFDKLTVLERVENAKSGGPRWLCKCDCGNEKIVKAGNLKNGSTKSCGCVRRSRVHNMIGKRFEKLVVIKRVENSKYRGAQWLCKCDCGGETIATTSILNSGKKVSCGCSAFHDLTGQRFGMLEVIKRSENTGEKVSWKCKCDCGCIAICTTSNLLQGTSQSCGCVRTKHNGKGTRLYRIWTGMKNRCLNPNSVEFKRYGGRGISVCEQWKEDFASFRDWALANGYEKPLSIDRINNDGNYEPRNCQWLTLADNSRKGSEPWPLENINQIS